MLASPEVLSLQCHSPACAVFSALQRSYSLFRDIYLCSRSWNCCSNSMDEDEDDEDEDAVVESMVNLRCSLYYLFYLDRMDAHR